MKTVDVTISGKIIPISTIPIGKYAELLKSMQSLPRLFEQFTNVESSKLLEYLPVIIGECTPDIIKIIKIGTTLSDEEINTLTINEIIGLLMAIVEVNEFKEAWEKVKKVLPQRKAVEKPGTTPPDGSDKPLIS